MSKIEDAAPATAILSSAAPESTTAQLAGAVPLEDKSVQITAPGGYPETPLADLDKEIKINPLPAANGAINPIELTPGEKIPDEVKAGGTTDNVTLDKESYEKSDRLPGDDKEFGVSPLPATKDALNPADGITTGSITDNVTLDKESYEKSDRIPGLDTGLGSQEPFVDIGKIIPEPSADDNKEFGVSPLPATEGALNPPDGFATGSITDNVTLDKESYEKSDRIPGLETGLGEQLPPISVGKIIPESSLPIVGADDNKEFSVNPLPATEGALNPPGGVAVGSITDNVTLDKESYEKSDRIPGIETDLPPVVGRNLIPESSLPIFGAGDATISSVSPESTTAALAGQVPLEKGDATINTVAPGSTTAALAGQVPLEKGDATISSVAPGSTTVALAGSVPLVASDFTINTVTPESTTTALAAKVPIEPKVPEIVKKSQEDANIEPEASAIVEEVKEKAAVEEELLKVVPEAPSTAEGTSGQGTQKTEADRTFVGSFTAAAVSAGAAAGVAALALRDSVGAAAKNASDKLPSYAQGVLSPSPRAAPEETTYEKVAAEVPAEVKESIEAAGQSPEAAANPVAVEEKKEVEAQLLKGGNELKHAVSAPQVPAADVPVEVKDSIKASGESPEAAANPVAVEEKKEVEAQLLKEVEEVKPVEAPKAAPVVEETTPAPAPAETNGTTAVAPEASTAAPASTSTEAATAGKADTAATAEKEKKKRHRISAFISKIKTKIHDL